MFSAADTARDLRKIAEWLDENPGEQVEYAGVKLVAYKRADLERIAERFGAWATEERPMYGDDVVIVRQFGTTRVRAAVPINDLLPEPVPSPEVAPIIPVAANV